MSYKNTEDQRAASRRHYIANKDKVIARKKAYRKAQYPVLQKAVLEYLTVHPCITCGESDPMVLEFDHRDRETKLAEISRLISNGTPRKLWEEIAKCDVLCCNCHRRRTRVQLGWTNR